MTSPCLLIHCCVLAAVALLAACSDPVEQRVEVPITPEYVGSDSCRDCHASQFGAWLGSHHQLAMQAASPDTVLGDFADASFDHYGLATRFVSRDGDFYVRTTIGGGREQEFRVAFTFGVEPLQQYLVEFPGGRMQALPFAWDTRDRASGGQRWFHIYGDEDIPPGDSLFWTGRQQNWNYMCAECHSTDVEMGYDTTTNTFNTTYAEISVGCEACHGPGSRHAALAAAGDTADGSGLVVDLDDRGDADWQMNIATGIADRSEPLSRPQLQPEACGRCHSRRGIIREHYEYGQPLADSHRLALLDEPLYFADGQILDEVYVYGSFVQSRMYRAGVTCTDCHDPHTAALVTGQDPNAVCAQCHLPSTFVAKDHAGHDPADADCVDCHMAERTYMVVDDRRDHSFRTPRPDLAERLGVPSACEQCHADKRPDWAIAALREWNGPDAMQRPHFAAAIDAGRSGFANPQLVEVLRDSDFPGIARATALTLFGAPLGNAEIEAIVDSLDDPDPLLRIAALRQLRALPADFRLQSPGAARLSDPVLGVRLEAALAFAGLADLMPAAVARDWGAAAREYRASFGIIANRPEARLSLGDFAMANGDVETAIRHYRDALRIEPMAAVARANLADAFRSAGDEASAESALREGLLLAPDNAVLQHSLGLLLARTGRLDDAMQLLRSAVTNAPGDPRFVYVLGVALNSTGQGAEALAVLREAHTRFPADFDIAWALATLLRDNGDIDGARRIASDLAALHPDSAAVIALRDSLGAGQ